MIDKIRQFLLKNQDEDYREFNSKLNPKLEKEQFIGVRTPKLKEFARELRRDLNCEEFLTSLPHMYFEENQLHAFIISQEKDFDKCIKLVEKFLPYVDNWATCDQLLPKVFAKNKEKLLPYIEKWIESKHTYTIRFAIGMLMKYYLDEDFDRKYPEMVIKVKNEDYYVKMMIAWYFATALAKRYDQILPYIKEKKLEKWVHNKTIQKSIESLRIKPEQKEKLRKLKIK